MYAFLAGFLAGIGVWVALPDVSLGRRFVASLLLCAAMFCAGRDAA